ncbi:SigB/SigF/SigG family RNA polymerase sigma factor [Actinomadura sp. WMMA1423]|uniref:SigB/SigF/SigG family RNA polymerase sigma factor n=1 Tax=Actinomadura sp. WMMA1423 TaxID=2591108 RepID=UPI00143CD903|nr:SigB/SigF/SigG family RNA polymerase sigma factor [Actinomadura sp. WMMA1423]
MTHAKAPVRDETRPAVPGRSEPPPAELLLDEMNHPETSPGRRSRLRAMLVDSQAPMVESIARRYAHRGEPLEDIRQVAYLGLVLAINRFDPERGDNFHAYAYPVILGEVRRHFRDRTWGIRVTRRIQELRPRLVDATQRFSQDNGRSPTPSELAELLGLGLDEVTEAIIAWDSYNPLSLDAPAEGASDTDTSLIVDHLGAEDPDLQHVVERKTLWSLLSELPERQRTIVLLRFFGNQTQTQIAERFGISQMHVSRLLSKSLLQLRHGMLPA